MGIMWVCLATCGGPASGLLARGESESAVTEAVSTEPALIRYGQHTSGWAISPAVDIDTFIFEGKAGDVTRVIVDGVDVDLDSRVEILDPNGELLGSEACSVNRFSSCSLSLQVRLTMDGEHRIVVSDSGANDTGRYVLQLEKLNGRDFPLLPYGVSVSGSLSPATDFDKWVIDVAPGSRVRILVEGRTVDLDPAVVVVDPEGEFDVATCNVNPYGTCSTVLEVDLTDPAATLSPGSYLLFVQESGADNTGNYNLNVECLFGPCPATRRFELVEAGRRCVDLLVTTDTASRGGEVTFAYRSSDVVPISVTPGPNLPEGAVISEFLTDLSLAECGSGSEVDRGLSVSWRYSDDGRTVLGPGCRRLLRFCFEREEDGDCTPFQFLDECVGAEGAPARNLLTGPRGESLTATGVDHCPRFIPPSQFVRGDVNGDGSHDVSDAISILTCLALDVACPTCSDTGDANDDGTMNVADAAYLIAWRFARGAAPPAPFPECGNDPSDDDPMTECFQPVCR